MYWNEKKVGTTPHIDDTLDPEWDLEIFLIKIDTEGPNSVEQSKLRIECLDWDQYGSDDVLGQIVLNGSQIKELADNNTAQNGPDGTQDDGLEEGDVEVIYEFVQKFQQMADQEGAVGGMIVGVPHDQQGKGKRRQKREGAPGEQASKREGGGGVVGEEIATEEDPSDIEKGMSIISERGAQGRAGQGVKKAKISVEGQRENGGEVIPIEEAGQDGNIEIPIHSYQSINDVGHGHKAMSDAPATTVADVQPKKSTESGSETLQNIPAGIPVDDSSGFITVPREEVAKVVELVSVDESCEVSDQNIATKDEVEGTGSLTPKEEGDTGRVQATKAENPGEILASRGEHITHNRFLGDVPVDIPVRFNGHGDQLGGENVRRAVVVAASYNIGEEVLTASVTARAEDTGADLPVDGLGSFKRDGNQAEVYVEEAELTPELPGSSVGKISASALSATGNTDAVDADSPDYKSHSAKRQANDVDDFILESAPPGVTSESPTSATKGGKAAKKKVKRESVVPNKTKIRASVVTEEATKLVSAVADKGAKEDSMAARYRDGE